MYLINFIWAKTGTFFAITLGMWALWRGTAVERIGVLLIWFTWILSPLVQTPEPGFDAGIAIVDFITLLGFVALSLWSRKLWTAFACAFMLLAVMGHFASLFTTDLSLFIYITANGFWGGYALLGALFAGMINVEKSRKVLTLSRS